MLETNNVFGGNRLNISVIIFLKFYAIVVTRYAYYKFQQQLSEVLEFERKNKFIWFWRGWRGI